MKQLKEALGDASLPQADGPRIIAHVVNDVGAWGAGFTGSLDRRWPEARKDYRLWYELRRHESGAFDHPGNLAMGNVRYTCVEGGLDGSGHPEHPLWIAHMVAQQGLRTTSHRPLRYDALGACLLKVSKTAKETNSSVHMPKIGSGLANGDWGVISELVFDAFVRQGIDVTVYKFQPKANA